MPNNVNFQIPFNPAEGQTAQVLAAIQSGYAIRQQQQQLAMQQQQMPSQIAEREANTKLATAQAATATLALQMKKDLLGTLTGTSPDAAPVTSPAPQTAATPTSPMTPVSSSTAPVDILRQAAGTPVSPQATGGGLIGRMVSNLTSDDSLSPTEKQAIRTAGNAAMLKAYADPSTALDGITNTYNDILKQHGDNQRAIKTDVMQDPKSNTGYSTVATHPDGTEAYRIPAQPPMPKTVEEAASMLGSATLALARDPSSAGNKQAVNLYTAQHDAMYADKLKMVQADARTASQARGADYEAMIRTGMNPITKEALNINNAPPSALVNPSNGQVIPQDMIGLYKPTGQERQTADTARQVLAIAEGLQKQVAANPGLIGPLAGRSQEALQKAGLSSQDASKMIDDRNFLTSAATKMHTGRFSSEILNKMDSMIKPGMNADEFNGAINSIHDVAERYANEDKLTTVYEYQQRQQFDSQPPPKANASQIPPGATMKVPGSDGKFHWSDGKTDLGPVL